MFDTVGIPKSVAQVYGVLYCADAPMTQEAVLQKLGVSTGSTSQALRLLSNLGAVHRLPVPGQRQTLFEAERSLRRLLSYFIDAQLRPKIKAGQARLEAIRAELPEDNTEALKKVEALLQWQRKAEKGLPLISGLLGK